MVIFGYEFGPHELGLLVIFLKGKLHREEIRELDAFLRDAAANPLSPELLTKLRGLVLTFIAQSRGH